MTAPLILSIGEAMVELSTADAGLWRLGIAGDTLNTAWYLRRCFGPDWRVGYFSRIGTGSFSQQMLAFLDDAGIESYVTTDPEREIGLYAISLRNGERSFSYWRETSAARRLADDPGALNAALCGCRMAYVSGITLAILSDQGRQTVLDALAGLRAMGGQVVFDPNLRPRLWADPDTMRHWVMRAGQVADMVLPSFDDEAAHFADPDPQATIARYRDQGAGGVIVKNAGGPVHFATRRGQGVLCDLPVQRPVDSTAAGDSFNAGLLAAMLHGADDRAAITAGHDLARQVVMKHGALVDVPPPVVPTKA